MYAKNTIRPDAMVFKDIEYMKKGMGTRERN